MDTQYTPAEIREHRRMWVEALRSGAYKQGTGYLCQVTETGERYYCCLGVACEVAGAAATQTVKTHGGVEVVVYDEGQSTILPLGVTEWLGVVGQNPCVPTSHGGAALSHLNDYEHWGFDQIADAIATIPDEGDRNWLPVTGGSGDDIR